MNIIRRLRQFADTPEAQAELDNRWELVVRSDPNPFAREQKISRIKKKREMEWSYWWNEYSSELNRLIGSFQVKSASKLLEKCPWKGMGPRGYMEMARQWEKIFDAVCEKKEGPYTPTGEIGREAVLKAILLAERANQPAIAQKIMKKASQHNFTSLTDTDTWAQVHFSRWRMDLQRSPHQALGELGKIGKKAVLRKDFEFFTNRWVDLCYAFEKEKNISMVEKSWQQAQAMALRAFNPDLLLQIESLRIRFKISRALPKTKPLQQ